MSIDQACSSTHDSYLREAIRDASCDANVMKSAHAIMPSLVRASIAASFTFVDISGK